MLMLPPVNNTALKDDGVVNITSLRTLNTLWQQFDDTVQDDASQQGSIWLTPSMQSRATFMWITVIKYTRGNPSQLICCALRKQKTRVGADLTRMGQH